MKSNFKLPAIILLTLLMGVSLPFRASAGGAKTAVPAETVTKHIDANMLLKDTFYIPQELRLKHETYNCGKFILTRQINPSWNSSFSVVTGFEGNILETRILKGINSVDEAYDYFNDNTTSHVYRGMEILEVDFEFKDKRKKLCWVGQVSFNSLDEAKAAIDETKNLIEKLGGSYQESLKVLKEYKAGTLMIPEPKVEPEKFKPNFQVQEDLFIKAYDKLNLKRYWGKYKDEVWYVYQVVGETTWRSTNFDQRNFDNLVGYFNNRLVVRGIKEPLMGSSFDPYIEGEVRWETNGKPYASTLDLAAGIEYRPFRRNKYILKKWYLQWLSNIRAFVEYKERNPLKERIDFSRNYDLIVGMDYFKEWGIDVPEEGQKDSFFWGELFMDHRYHTTNFTSIDDYDSFIFNTAVRVGFKWPRIPLPDNPINDELVIMPYVLFDQVSNTNRSLYFENRIFGGVGVRFMPFRTLRFASSEWLYKTKIFFEYNGLNYVKYHKKDPPTDIPEKDFRFGINISLNRF